MLIKNAFEVPQRSVLIWTLFLKSWMSCRLDTNTSPPKSLYHMRAGFTRGLSPQPNKYPNQGVGHYCWITNHPTLPTQSRGGKTVLSWSLQADCNQETGLLTIRGCKWTKRGMDEKVHIFNFLDRRSSYKEFENNNLQQAWGNYRLGRNLIYRKIL